MNEDPHHSEPYASEQQAELVHAAVLMEAFSSCRVMMLYRSAGGKLVVCALVGEVYPAFISKPINTIASLDFRVMASFDALMSFATRNSPF
ncbi:hypothetical protein AD936_22985 [Gluconobacter japonicus]|nr:hypothetical protein AD936_22985 [Gluconobacter japonicus]